MRYHITLICTVLFTALGCREDRQVDILPIVNNLDVQFDLLDEKGISSNSFYPGENFVFSLILKNGSNELILFRGFDYEDFCRVTRLESFEPNESNDQPKDMGKPNVNMFCDYAAGSLILPKTDLKFQIEWSPPETGAFFCITNQNPPLAPGRYQTGFQTRFLLNYDGVDIETDTFQFNIEFEVI